MGEPITNAKFKEIVSVIATVGGDWTVSMLKDGFFLRHAGAEYKLTPEQSGFMFKHVPRQVTRRPRKR